MILFGYEKSVIKLGLLIEITHLKSISYKERTKTLEFTLSQFCQIKPFSGENKLSLPQNK